MSHGGKAKLQFDIRAMTRFERSGWGYVKVEGMEWNGREAVSAVGWKTRLVDLGKGPFGFHALHYRYSRLGPESTDGSKNVHCTVSFVHAGSYPPPLFLQLLVAFVHAGTRYRRTQSPLVLLWRE